LTHVTLSFRSFAMVLCLLLFHLTCKRVLVINTCTPRVRL
jgi:hypothetical protein